VQVHPNLRFTQTALTIPTILLPTLSCVLFRRQPLSKLEKWIHSHPALARFILLVLAGINAYSACHIFPSSPLLAFAQGTLSVLMLLGAIVVP
jgi:hypothetical protein